MSPLAEVQDAIARTLLSGDPGFAPVSLVGGRSVQSRLDIHVRHFAASLGSALNDKFPATAWLLGGDRMAAVTARFLRKCPPKTPCIAEWGGAFPAFTATGNELKSLPYIEAFASLEWALGRVSIATDRQALMWTDVLATGADRLLDAVLILQTGIAHLRATHNVDELIGHYLRDETPANFTLLAGEALIEVRGARGRFRIDRLNPDMYAFRSAIAAGHSIGDAAGNALELNPNFDAGRAIKGLVDSRLVTSIEIHQKDRL
jgi:hypothetical protein